MAIDLPLPLARPRVNGRRLVHFPVYCAILRDGEGTKLGFKKYIDCHSLSQ